MTETPTSRKPSTGSRPEGVRGVRSRRADGTEVIYWYCRHTGTRLPDIEDPGFAAAVAEARRPKRQAHAKGTLGALLADWRASEEWRVTAPATKASRDRYLAAIEGPQWLARQVVDLGPEGFRQLREELLDIREGIAKKKGRGAGAVFGNAVASLFAWAIKRGKAMASPLQKMPALEGGHIPAWTEPDAQIAMTTWPEPVRRAVILNYHIGQRRGDLTMLRWEAYDAAAGRILLQPEKTRRKREAKGLGPLRIVVSSALAWELRRWREAAPEAEYILTRADGRPWTKGALSMAVREQLIKAGMPTKRGLHGLRKLRATIFAEHGATAGLIAAAQGWESERTVGIYTADADQEKMARAAVDLVEKAVSKTGK